MRPPSSVSRRAWLMGAGAVVAWASSPARALMDGSAPASTDLNALIARMTVEEKAGQVTLMAAAWAGGAANALNPTSPSRASFRQQMDDVRRGHVGGVFNGNGAEMARQMQTMAVEKSRLKIPLIFAADVIHGFRTVF
ncbi:MAG: glycoside hydrolase family 3 N-terminal domain-containing protein, partial [Pseudomonadota bacterium]|nr:glycoside hydrolase family 3 N-terminal domain-containing protein [Pseudomonadota bacterium]